MWALREKGGVDPLMVDANKAALVSYAAMFLQDKFCKLLVYGENDDVEEIRLFGPAREVRSDKRYGPALLHLG
jgi:hypothetical protein